MDPSLYTFELSPTTWVYQASLLTIAIFFRFNRLASVRNLDLLLIILLAPGPLLIAQGAAMGPDVQRWGYLWLIGVGALWFVRLFVDPLLVRRPLLEPNLSPAARTFSGTVAVGPVIGGGRHVPGHPRRSRRGPWRRSASACSVARAWPSPPSEHGPGYPLLHLLAGVPEQSADSGVGRA